MSPKEAIEAAATMASAGVKKAPVAWAVAFTVLGCCGMVLACYSAFIEPASAADKLSRSEFREWVQEHEGNGHDGHATKADVQAVQSAVQAARRDLTGAAAAQAATATALRELHADVREIRAELRGK
jgi:pyruvate/2-oxoglutarate dehydrogenase complex dihydrolipoamide acyltransferase (E2) component